MPKYRITTDKGVYEVTTSEGGQPAQPDGFFGALGSDIKNLIQSIPSMGATMGNPGAMAQLGASQAAQIGTEDVLRKQEGRSAPYRAVAGLGTALGINSRGMEEEANKGSMAGVLGHAALPTALAVGPSILNRAAPAIADMTAAPREAIAGQGSRLVNAVLGSGVKREILIGNNPGQAVIDEGLLGSGLTTKSTLKDRIAARSGEIGNQVREAIGSSTQRIPVLDAAKKVFDNLIDHAGTSGAESALQSEKAYWERKIGKYADANGTVSMQYAWRLKKDAGDATNFAFNGEVEGAKNKALSDVYHVFQEGMNQADPRLAPLNERWSNMIGAEKALAKTIASDQGKAILSLRGAAAAMGATPARLSLARALQVLKPADQLAPLEALKSKLAGNQ